jgi:putative spermidine/putrescine transport system permease protein
MAALSGRSGRKEVVAPRQRLTLLLLLLPIGVLLTVFFVLPFLFEVGFSVQRYDPSVGYLPGITLRNYGRFFTDDYYLTIWWRTVRIAVITMVLCVILAYPVAIVLARARGWVKTALLLVTISPLFVSTVVRAYGWILILGPNGPVVKILMASGLSPERPRIIYTETAVIIGMVEAMLPFTVLPISAVVGRIDQNLLHQAQSLGANPFQTFLRITLPLSVPGMAAGSILVFISAMGSFVTPSLLGGARIKTLAYEAYATMTTMSDWSLSSTLGVVLLATTLLGIFIQARVLSGAANRARSGADRG